MIQEKTGDKYFYDTYALIELVKKNKNYEYYSNFTLYMLGQNLIELYYQLLIAYGEETAKKYYIVLKNNIIEMDDEMIFEACRFRQKHKKKHLSYVDCLGYTCAKMKGMKFLTGDKEFKGMDNVEFVK
jgi:uncharacterized protein